ncbi:interleukin-3 receptor subunit alpha-like [Molossus nigricans]
MAGLWLAVFLTPVCSLLRDQALNPPITNLRMVPERKQLTWNNTKNISSVECYVDSRLFRKLENNGSCEISVLSKCKASNFTVKVTVVDDEPYSTWIEYPKPEGNPGAAAKDLHCKVHDVDFLTCTWAVGSEAPNDTQYLFTLENVGTNQRWECPHYTSNERGTHVQCQFDKISRFPENQYRFLVEGVSAEGGILCSEFFELLEDIEELIAPNITATCNESLALMEWEMASLFHRNFEYNLEIQQGTEPPSSHKVHGKQWTLNNPGTFTVKIQALAGLWSAPQRFVCGRAGGALHQLWLTASLIALAAVLTVGVAVVLCRRYSVLKKLLPPIPHMKDPLRDTCQGEKIMAWEAGPLTQDCPVAEVQVLKET